LKPLFTIHAGEFLFGEYIEQNFRGARLWIPAKDTGVDFLITDTSGNNSVSVQVKMSKDYRPIISSSELDIGLVGGGWFVFSHLALESSTAEIWSIVLVSHERGIKPAFINIPPKNLLAKLVEIHGKRKSYHFYPWLLSDGTCIEGRGMKKPDKQALAKGQCVLNSRDLTQYRGNWEFMDRFNIASK